jgi:ribosomal protein L11 methyltransferase
MGNTWLSLYPIQTKKEEKMKYLEFTFCTQPCTETVNDVLAGLLGDAGFESFVEEEGGMKAYIQQSLFDKAAVDEVVATFPIPDTTVSYTYIEAEDKDWNEEWEKNFFQPIVIGDRCVIHSTFHHDVPKAEYDIVINPQMAFGTGHHETTNLIIEELLDADLKGKRLLDMGCGTSILAILARMRGAQPCTAIDIDEWCVRNSIENIALNGLDGITVLQGDASSLPGKGPFDVVIANINRNILLNDMHQYRACMSAGAELYMSGFYVDDIPAIRAEAEKHGLVFVEYREKNRWSVVKMKVHA